MPFDPIEVRLAIERSTSSSMMPSTGVTTFCSIAIKAESMAVETPLETFSAQLGFAPSQIMPVMLPIMFLMA